MALETRDLPLQTRSAQVRSFDEAKRSFDLVWSTGARVRRYDWRYERSYDEELSLEPGHVRMGRLASGRAPLLDDHRAWNGVRSNLGVVTTAALSSGEGTATVKFSKRADAVEVMEDVKDGITTNVSVGYRTHKVEMQPPKKDGDVWVYRAVDWEPYELSLTPMPAETGANVRSADPFEGKRSAPCEFINPAESTATTQESPMLRSLAAALGVKVEKDAADTAVRSAVIASLGVKAESTDDEIVAAALARKAPAVSEPAAPLDAVAQARVEATKAEQARSADIIKLCAKHGADAEFQARALQSGWTPERTGLEILNERAAKGETFGPHNTQTQGELKKRSTSVWDELRNKGGK